MDSLVKFWNFLRPVSRLKSNVDIDIEDFKITKYPTDGQDILKTTNETIRVSNKIPCYEINCFLTSICIIVNIIDFENGPPRHGAEQDELKLITLFRALNYTVFYFSNLTSTLYNRMIEKFKKHFESHKYNSMIFIVLSHGTCNTGSQITKVLFSDNKLLNFLHTVEKFNNKNCKELAGMPKGYFCLTCRGDKRDKIVKIATDGPFCSSNQRALPKKFKIVSTYSDIIVAFSTVVGYVSFRNWYVEELYNVVKENSRTMHLEDILKLVGLKLHESIEFSKETQTTSYENLGMFKHFYLQEPRIETP